jgi:hypothetical protein
MLLDICTIRNYIPSYLFTHTMIKLKRHDNAERHVQSTQLLHSHSSAAPTFPIVCFVTSSLTFPTFFAESKIAPSIALSASTSSLR